MHFKHKRDATEFEIARKHFFSPQPFLWPWCSASEIHRTRIGGWILWSFGCLCELSTSYWQMISRFQNYLEDTLQLNFLFAFAVWAPCRCTSRNRKAWTPATVRRLWVPYLAQQANFLSLLKRKSSQSPSTTVLTCFNHYSFMLIMINTRADNIWQP